MKCCLRFDWQCILLTLCLGTISGRAAEVPRLSANEIIEKAIEHAQAQATNNLRSSYSYTKHVVTQELDSKERVKETKEKVFLVQSGIGYLQAMKINGKPASEKEMQKQNKQAIEARQKLTGSDSGKSSENWEKFLSPNVYARYKFTLLRHELINNRPSYVLSFVPLPGKLPVKNLMDRALNQLTGTIWIDGQEFEVAKADLYLQSKVALGGFMEIFGALKTFHYSVERLRIDQFVWLNHRTKGEYEGRKLWDSTHIRTETLSSDFQRMAAATATSFSTSP